MTTPAPCPRQSLHSKSEPVGYLAWHAWAEKMSKRFDCVRCPGCGLFKVWKVKPHGN